MERVREFEIAHLQRTLVERDPLDNAAGRRPSGSAPKAGIRGCSRLEIRGIGEPGLAHAGAQIGVAIGAELLRRRPPCAAGPHARYGIRRSGPGVWPKALPTDCWKPAQAAELRRRLLHAGSAVGMVVDVGVAGLCRRCRAPARTAGRGRPGNWRSARHGRWRGRRCSTADRRGSPSPSGRHRRDSDRRRRSARRGRCAEHQQGQHPGRGALARHHRLQREAAGVEAVVLGVGVGALRCRSARPRCRIPAAGCEAGRGRP